MELTKKKILLVDDEKDVGFAVKSGLENLDSSFEVHTVKSGKECLEILNQDFNPDLILLDIMMPEMNGWEVLNRLRDKPTWSKIPVIFLTARTDDFTKTFGKTVVKEFIEKPFDIDNLKNKINQVLNETYQK